MANDERTTMHFQNVRFPDGSTVIVVTLDIVSSSDMILKLDRRGQVPRFWDVLTPLKHFLADSQMNDGLLFNHYNFVGDGWILLFAPETTGTQLLKFMQGVSQTYRRAIQPILSRLGDEAPDKVGINFGIDHGPVYTGLIFQQHEYIGSPMIISSRLQGAIKTLEDDPTYKALVSKTTFDSYFRSTAVPSVREVAPDLHNVGRKFQSSLISGL
jgi:hypothetical protein